MLYSCIALIHKTLYKWTSDEERNEYGIEDHINYLLPFYIFCANIISRLDFELEFL